MIKSDSDDDDAGGSKSLQYKLIILGDGAVGKTSVINRYCQGGFAQSYKQTIGVDFYSKTIELPNIRSTTPPAYSIDKKDGFDKNSSVSTRFDTNLDNEDSKKGVSSSNKTVNVTLQIWDIGGQQIGGKMLAKYIYGCHAICFLYDVTNIESFKNVEDWLNFVRKCYNVDPPAPFAKEVNLNKDVLNNIGGESEGKAQAATGLSSTFVPAPDLPFMALVGNKIDLPTRQIRSDKHNAFAVENGLYAYFVSAKTGERVNWMFQSIAAELADIKISRADMEIRQQKVTAAIVQYPTFNSDICSIKNKNVTQDYNDNSTAIVAEKDRVINATKENITNKSINNDNQNIKNCIMM